MTIELSLLLSGISVAFAVYFGMHTKHRNEEKDTVEKTEGQTEKNTMVMVKLENIADDIKDIKRESRENRESIGMLRERIANVEQSVKSCHKRLDGVLKTEL